MALRIDACNHTKITMESLAKKIGYTREYLQAIKSGKKGQTLENLQKLAGALGCAPAELLPLSWQVPFVDLNETKENISRIVTIYEQLKQKQNNLTSDHVARVIAALTQIPSASVLGDEEIIRCFHITTLK